MGNVHFTEILDFFLGWVTFDISKDDWATRIADEERALNNQGKDKTKEPAEEPPEVTPEKPAKEPPPRKPEKESPPRHKKYDLRDIIP